MGYSRYWKPQIFNTFSVEIRPDKRSCILLLPLLLRGIGGLPLSFTSSTSNNYRYIFGFGTCKTSWIIMIIFCPKVCNLRLTKEFLWLSYISCIFWNQSTSLKLRQEPNCDLNWMHNEHLNTVSGTDIIRLLRFRTDHFSGHLLPFLCTASFQVEIKIFSFRIIIRRFTRRFWIIMQY